MLLGTTLPEAYAMESLLQLLDQMEVVMQQEPNSAPAIARQHGGSPQMIPVS